MADFSLELLIDAEDLKIIRTAQLKITIAKPVNTGVNTLASSGTPNVIWLVLDPFEINNVAWTKNYSIYASTQIELTNGTFISKISQTDCPAQDAAYYSFTSAAVFTGPFTGSGAGAPGTYKVNNDLPNMHYRALAFGLQQKASINGNRIDLSPLNAAVVPANFPVNFMPLTELYVWLQTPSTSGTVITAVAGNAAVVTFGSSVTKQVLKYNPARGTFVPASSDG